jgi:quinol monooxygenase YgiN
MNPTSTEIIGIGRFKILEGKLDEYKRLHALCEVSVRTKDTGTLQYDLFFSEDQSEVCFIERYVNSAALIEHITNLGPLFNEVVAIVQVVHGEILGNVSSELKAAMAGGPVKLFMPYAGE